MSIVSATQFVPKTKTLGSWNPDALKWDDVYVDFVSKTWGITANMEMVPNKKPRFTHPLSITGVKYGSEAQAKGIRVRDVVVGVRFEGTDKYTEVVPDQVNDGTKNKTCYVSDAIRDLLLAGGPVSLHLKRENRLQKCEECGSDAIIEITEQGDLTCENCGVVHRGSLISMSSEWRSFADDDNKSDPNRTGGPENPLLAGGDGMQTMIGGGAGGRLQADQLGTAANLGKTQHRNSAGASIRPLTDAYREVESMCNRMDLVGNVIQSAKELYQQVDDARQKGQKVGKGMEAIVASCVYLACRKHDVPRTLKEICAVTTCSKHDLGKTFKHVQQITKIKLGAVTAQSIIERFSSHLGLPHEIIVLAQAIAEKAAEINVGEGRVHASVAGASIMMAVQLHVNKPEWRSGKAISEATGAAEATIRLIFKDMYAKRLQLVPEKFATRQEVEAMPSS